MTTFHVAKSGSDSNGGTSLADAFLTLGKAHTECVSGRGDVVYVYPGQYNERLTITKDATTWQAIDPNNKPIIFAEATADYQDIVRIKTGCVFDGFELHGTKSDPWTYYQDNAINAGGDSFAGRNTKQVIIRNCECHHVGAAGIQLRFQENAIVEDNEIHDCAMRNYQRRAWTGDPEDENDPDYLGYHPGGNSFTRGAEYTIRRNYVHDCWGEGLPFDFGVFGAYVYDNVVGRSYSSRIYLGEVVDGFVYRNLLFNPSDRDVWMNHNVDNGLGMDDESNYNQTSNGYVDNVHFFNNIVVDCLHGIWIGHGIDELDTKNVHFYNNTIIALHADVKAIGVNGWAYSNVTVTDNIFYVKSGSSAGYNDAGSVVSIDRNLWNITPPWTETNGEVANPLLVDPEAVIADSLLTSIDTGDYKVSSSSPAIAKAISDLPEDFFGYGRPSPGARGAHEPDGTEPDDDPDPTPTTTAFCKNIAYHGEHIDKRPSTIGRGRFVRAGSYVDLNDASGIAAINRLTGSFHMLVHLDDLAPDTDTPLNAFEFYGWKGSNGNSSLIKFGVDADRVNAFFEMWAGDNSGANKGRISAPLGIFHWTEQLVLSIEYEYDGSSGYDIRGYVNGLIVGSDTVTGLWDGEEHIMHVGSPNTYSWHGDVADLVHISGTTLTSLEIAELCSWIRLDKLSSQTVANYHQLYMWWGLRDEDDTLPSTVIVTQPTTPNPGEYSVEWSADAVARYYELHETNNPDDPQPTWETIYIGEMLTMDLSRTPGTREYRVVAANDAGHSLVSNVVRVVVDPDPDQEVSRAVSISDIYGEVTAVVDIGDGRHRVTVEIGTGSGGIGATVRPGQVMQELGVAGDFVMGATVIDPHGSPYLGGHRFEGGNPLDAENWSPLFRLGQISGWRGLPDQLGLIAGPEPNKWVIFSDDRVETQGVTQTAKNAQGFDAIKIDPDVPSLAVGVPLPTGPSSGGPGFWVGEVDGVIELRVGGAQGPNQTWGVNGMIIRNGNNLEVIRFAADGKSYFSNRIDIGPLGSIVANSATFSERGITLKTLIGVGSLPPDFPPEPEPDSSVLTYRAGDHDTARVYATGSGVGDTQMHIEATGRPAGGPVYNTLELKALSGGGGGSARIELQTVQGVRSQSLIRFKLNGQTVASWQAGATLEDSKNATPRMFANLAPEILPLGYRDFEGDAWRTLSGYSFFSALGSELSNAPFTPVDATVYYVLVEAESDKDGFYSHYVTVTTNTASDVQPAVYVRAGTDWENEQADWRVVGFKDEVLLVANDLSDLNSAAAAQNNLVLLPGRDVLMFYAALNDLGLLTNTSGAADKLPYMDASDTFALTDLTAFIRTLLAAADAAAARTVLDVPATGDVPDELTDLDTAVTGAQLDADHSKLAGIEASATADQTAGEIEAIVSHDNLLDFEANEHVALPNTIANVLSDAGTMAEQDSDDVDITGGTIADTEISNCEITSLDGVLAVGDGGTGAASASAARTNLEISQRVVDDAGSGENIISGYSGNSINSDVSVGTISGGGNSGNENEIGTESSTGASFATIGGGYDNKNDSLAGVIAGGGHNEAQADSDHATIGGGSLNVISNGSYPTVAGGTLNEASGDHAAIVGGYSNEASGQAAVVGGYDNDVSGDFSLAAGFENEVSGRYGLATGRDHDVAKDYAIAQGRAAKPAVVGAVTVAAGSIAAAGDAQSSYCQLRAQTTDGTQTNMTTPDGGVIGLTLPDDTTFGFVAWIVARRTDADNESAFYKIDGCIDRNAGTTALVGSVAVTTIAEDTAAWSVTATANDGSDALLIKVTGEASKTINWSCRLLLVEVTG